MSFRQWCRRNGSQRLFMPRTRDWLSLHFFLTRLLRALDDDDAYEPGIWGEQ